MSDENVETPIKENAIAQEPVQTQEIQENPEEINWRRFRQEKEAQRKAKEEAERIAIEKAKEAEALKAAMAALMQKPIHQEYEREQTEEDVIEKRVQEALKRERERYDQERKAQEQKEYPQMLRKNFSDIDTICTPENLDYLEYHYPEVAEPYKHMPEGYDKWAGIYKALKRFIPNKDAAKEAKKADANLAKPVAMSRPGMTQSGDQAPRILNDTTRQKNWERMQRIMKTPG
jgi:hypothetical protein